MKDYLEYYNNLDVIPFIQAVEQVLAATSFTKKGRQSASGGRKETARYLSGSNRDCRSQIGWIEDHERADEGDLLG